MLWRWTGTRLRTHAGEPIELAHAVPAALATFYALLTPLQLNTLPGRAGLVTATVSLGSAVFCGAVAFGARRKLQPTRRGWVVAALGAVLIANGSARLVVTGDLRYTAALALGIVAVAGFVSSRATVAMLAATGATIWLSEVVAVRAPIGTVYLSGFYLAMAITLAGGLHALRLHREHGLRTARRRLDTQYESLAAAHSALASSENRYRTVFAASPVGISLSDEHGHFVAVNDALCRLLGRDESAILGHGAAEFTHPDDVAMQARVGQLIENSPDGIVRIEKRYVRPDGEARWGWLTLTHTPGPAGQTWTLAHMQDTTHRKLSEQALIESEANLTAVSRVMHRIQQGADAREAIVEAGVEVSGAGYACLLEPCRDRTALQVSATTDAALAGVVVTFPATSAIIEVYRTGEASFLSEVEGNRRVSPAMVELTGSRSVYLAPVSANSDVIGVLAVGWRYPLAEIDDRRARAIALLTAEAGVALRQASLVAELAELAETDPLTRLPNRRGWDQTLTRLLAQAGHTGEPLTVALVDIDNFKRFNDRFGHPAGDYLLKNFADAGRAALRAVDAIARWGGEEFAVALPNCGPEQASSILERVRSAISEQQSCSVGFAVWDGSEGADGLLARADRALYAAKNAGRNRIRAAAPPARQDASTAH